MKHCPDSIFFLSLFASSPPLPLLSIYSLKVKTNLGLSVLENAQSLHVFKSNSIRVAFNSQETTDHLQACESERKFAKTAGSPGDWALNSPIRQKFAKSVTVWVTETANWARQRQPATSHVLE